MRYLKKYFLFLEKNTTYDYGCVMIEIDFEEQKKIQSTIDKNDLFETQDEKHGFETEPHLTLLYGLHQDVSDEDVINVLNKFDLKNLNIKIDGIDNFENEYFDVLKFNVEKLDVLEKIHNQLKRLPNSDKYTQYNPHITIAYLKKGTSKKYLDKSFKKTFSRIDSIVYSKSNGDKIKIKI